jgi:hypothetical protein
VNRSRGEAAVSFGGLAGGAFGGGLSHVRSPIRALGFPMQADAEWLAEAPLAAVTIEPEETIRRVVRIEGLRFDSLPAVGGRGL